MGKTENLDRSLKLIAKSSLILFIGVTLSKILTIVYRIIIARNFGSEDYGLFSLFLIISTLILTFSTFGLAEGLLRYISFFRGKKQNKEIRYIIKKSIIFLLFSGLFFGLLLFFGAGFISIKIFHNVNLIPYLKIFSLVLPFAILLDVFVSIIRAFEKMGPYSFIWNIFSGIIKPLLLLAFIFIGLKGNSIIFSYCLGIILTLSLAYFYSRYKIPQTLIGETNSIKDGKKITKDLFFYSIPIIFIGFTANILSWIDSILLGYFKGISEVGIYNSVIPIATILIIAPTIFLGIFFPLIVKEYSKKNVYAIKELSKQVGKWIFIINFPIFILLFIYPGIFIKIFFGEGYFAATNALRILSVGAIVNSMFLISYNLILMVGKSKKILYSLVITNVINIFLNIILIPLPRVLGMDNSLGINGAAIATTTSTILFNIILLFQARHYTSIIPVKRKMLKIFLVTLIPVFSLLLFKHLFPVNTLILFLIGTFFILFYLVLIIFTKCLDNNDFMILRLIKQKTTNRK